MKTIVHAANRARALPTPGLRYPEDPDSAEDKETRRPGDKETGEFPAVSLSPCLPVSLSSTESGSSGYLRPGVGFAACASSQHFDILGSRWTIPHRMPDVKIPDISATS